MKRIGLLITLFLSLGSFNSVEEQLLPTKLRIAIINDLGNFVEGASVSLYENEEDYRGSKNAVAMLLTDEKGRVTFTDLKPMAYYVEAKKGEMNNNGAGVQTSVLSEKKINKVNIVIK